MNKKLRQRSVFSCGSIVTLHATAYWNQKEINRFGNKKNIHCSKIYLKLYLSRFLDRTILQNNTLVPLAHLS